MWKCEYFFCLFNKYVVEIDIVYVWLIHKNCIMYYLPSNGGKIIGTNFQKLHFKITHILKYWDDDLRILWVKTVHNINSMFPVNI